MKEGPPVNTEGEHWSGLATKESGCQCGRPWMVDSASLLLFHRAVCLDTVPGDAGGRVVDRCAGSVLAEEPTGGDTGQLPDPGSAGCRSDSDKALHPGISAVGDLGGGTRRRLRAGHWRGRVCAGRNGPV